MAGVKFKNCIGDYADIEIIKGATLDWSLIWGGEDAPIDNSGYTAVWTIARSNDDGDPVRFSFSSLVGSPPAEGTITIGGEGGEFRFQMDAADSAELPELQNGKHRLMITDSTGNVMRALYGRADVPAQVD